MADPQDGTGELGEGVTGLVPVEALPGEGYRLEADGLELVAARGARCFRVGTALEVEIRGADEDAARIELGLPVAGAAPRRGARRGRRPDCARPR